MGSDDVICRDFMRGVCTRDSASCKFKHPNSETTELCKDFVRGACDRAERCKYKHAIVCRETFCQRKNCKFLHRAPPTGQRNPNSFDSAKFGPPSSPRGGRGGGPGPRGGGDSFGDRSKRLFGDEPDNICKYFLRGDCSRISCPFLHEFPNKRPRRDMDPLSQSSFRPPPFDYPPMGGGGGGGDGRGAPPSSVPPPFWNAQQLSGPEGPNIGSFNDYSAGLDLRVYVTQLETKVKLYEDRIRDLEKRCEQYEDFNKLLTERNNELKSKLGIDAGRRSYY